MHSLYDYLKQIIQTHKDVLEMQELFGQYF